MKKILSAFCAISLLVAPVALPLATTGCTTTQKKASYQTLAAVGAAVDNAMKAYAEGVVAGKVTDAQRAKVRKAKAEFNASYALACDAAAYDYNQFAPQDLIKLKDGILAVIAEVTK